MAGFEAAFPPDDTGRTTFERFRYQAHVAFRFCLAAVSIEGKIKAVVCEHFEDIAVLDDGGWRLIQIKTRDQDLGPWRLTDLLAKSGALRGLYRTYKALEKIDGGNDCRLEGWLEGVIARKDDARCLTNLSAPAGAWDRTVERCRKALKITKEEAEAFLKRVKLVDNLPNRELIRDVNLELLRKASPTQTGPQVVEVYTRVFSRLEGAMEGTLLADAFPQVVLAPASAGEAAQQLFENKRLTQEQLRELFGDLDDPGVLRRIEDPEALRTTALETKLRRAGATDAIVEDAKHLRANAVIREAEIGAMSMMDPKARLADVQQRVLIVGNGVVATEQSTPPGPAVWTRARQEIAANPSSVDLRSLFGKDDMLLLGELCEVSDQCRFAWGAGDDNGGRRDAT